MRDVLQAFLFGVGVFYVFYMIAYSSFLFLAVAVGSSTLYSQKRRNMLKNELLSDYYVPVSVIVPAYNEEVTIEASIRSLLSLKYKAYEIIIIDDGSKDGTCAKVVETFGLKRINRPIQISVPCQQAEAVYESDAHGVPITLVRKNGISEPVGKKLLNRDLPLIGTGV